MHTNFSTCIEIFCSLIVVLSTICGKSCLSSGDVFPHSVQFIEPVVEFLESTSSWEVRFVLYAWLLVLVKVPFDFSTLGMESLGDRIFAVALQDLDERRNRPMTKMASALVGLLVNRSSGERTSFFPKFLSLFDKLPLESYLDGLGCIVKGGRDIAGIHAFIAVQNQLSRMSPKSSLEIEAFLRVIGSLPLCGDSDERLSGAESMLDSVWGYVNHPESRVRDKVAKCVFRLSRVLRREYRDQLEAFVLESDFFARDHESIHTRILFLGELMRRGDEVSPNTRHRCVSLLAVSLEFQGRTPALSQLVRDAGCVVVWAIARGWSRDDLMIIADAVLPSLLTLALFDRDVNLRRAASAATQELVGRIGSDKFPQGLAIVELVDFWSVAQLKDAMVEIPSKLVRVSGGSTPSGGEGAHTFSDFFSEKFVSHLKALIANSAKCTPAYLRLVACGLSRLIDAIEQVPGIAEKILSPTTQNSVRFAYLVVLVEFLKAPQTLQESVPPSIQTVYRNIVPQLDKLRLFRGKQGDLVRVASYELLGAIFQRPDFERKDKFAQKCFLLLKEGIVHLVPSVSQAAVDAFAWWAAIQPEETVAQSVDELIREYVLNTTANVAARRGVFAAIAGVAYTGRVPEICLSEILSWPTHWLGNQDLLDHQTREIATHMVGKLAVSSDDTEVWRYVTALISASDDFETEKQSGADFGWIVRETAVHALGDYLSNRDMVGDENKNRVIECLVSRLGDRYEKVRSAALAALIGVLVDRIAETNPLDVYLDILFGSKVTLSPALLVNLAGTVTVLGAEQWMRKFSERIPNREFGNQLVGAMVSLLSEPDCPVRIQGRNDWVSRVFTPAVKLIAAIPEYVTEPQNERIFELVLIELRRGSLGVAKLKAVGKLAAVLGQTYPQAWYSVLVQYVFLSGMPTARHAVAMELALATEDEQVSALIGEADWVGESETAWMDQLMQLCRVWEIPEDSVAKWNCAKTAKTTKHVSYSDLVRDEHWLG